ncbi:alpha/beta hydrolase [Flavobacterium sp.]|jgi:pimeloyl-ACP methyl ester carboxylesterase|uniref:alpha/beta hydrolase n=1 Tax=Flavobacterium sp. TaxID=239 RepID=UPI0037C04086
MKKIKYFLLTKSIGFGLNSLSYFQPKKATKIAYRLFSKPRRGKLVKDNLPNFLQNIPSQRFFADEHHLETYIWRGNAHVILLVHGWESNTSRWEKLLPYLQQTGSTIVAIDAPGHGLSGGSEFNVVKYASYIDVAVKQYKPAVLIGHSIGGAACIYYQSEYKNQDLQRMVVLGAPSDYTIIVSNYVKLLSLNKRMKRFLERAFSEKFNKEISDFSMAAFAKKIQIPGIIVHDREDKIVAFGEGQKIAAAWKNAQFIQTEGLGHSLHDDEVYEKIISFLRG